MTFSQILKQLREDSNLAQKDVAEYLGMTRQAIALYELGKREPDFDVLIKIADFFRVSIDYLLGRVNCKDLNSVTIGKNIELIKGNFTYKELSEAISKKIGIVISPEMLDLYAKGERIPNQGTLSIIAKFIGVRELFFHVPNTIETLIKERNYYIKEHERVESDKNLVSVLDLLKSKDREMLEWLLKDSNIKYIKLAQEIQEAGLPAEALRTLIDNGIKNKDR